MADALHVFDRIGWEAAAVVAVVALAGWMALRVSSRPVRGTLATLTVTAAAIAGLFAYVRLTIDRDQAAERRAIEIRQTELAAHAFAPGSPLACLDGAAGETVETACEKALFARPEVTAAAVAYVTARLSLLADATRLADRGENFVAIVAGLRRSLELDRYGIAAHVLATRDGCSIETCRAFAWVDDPSALKANLKAHAFDGYVARYAAFWNKPDEPAKPPAPADAPQANAAPPPPAAPFSSRYDFPSAASIPPVSIMNKEPPRPPEGDATAPAQTAQQPQAAPAPDVPLPVPPKRPQTQGAAPR